jgi:hypothetical protein
VGGRRGSIANVPSSDPFEHVSGKMVFWVLVLEELTMALEIERGREDEAPVDGED